MLSLCLSRQLWKCSQRGKDKRQTSRFAKTDSGSADDRICRHDDGVGDLRAEAGAGLNLQGWSRRPAMI
jgi:hypothetical protein